MITDSTESQPQSASIYKMMKFTLSLFLLLQTVLVVQGFWCDTGEVERQKGKVAVLENKIFNLQHERDNAKSDLKSCQNNKETLKVLYEYYGMMVIDYVPN